MIARQFVDTTNLPHDEWLKMRRMGIGGSDVAPICGLSRFRSPFAVYQDKLGEAPEIEDNAKMEAGRRLEPTIRQWFADKAGKRVNEFYAILRHPTHDFMQANIDGWLPEENAGLECKNTEGWNRDEWKNGQAPIEYVLQCNHYMAVTGAHRWYIAVLINGWEFQYTHVDRDEEIIQMIIDKERYFWEEHVQAKIPPAFAANDTDYLNRIYKEANRKSSVNLPSDKKAIITKARALKNEIESAKKGYEEMRNILKGEAKENELIYIDGDLVATWKADKNGKRTFKLIGEE